MKEIEKTITFELTPEEYANRVKLVADKILSENRAGGWVSVRRVKVTPSFDSNYNRYYIKLYFEKAGF